MAVVRAKKFLGQHFLKDENIAKKIVSSLNAIAIPEKAEYKKVLEIGPGMGVLTKHLLNEKQVELSVVEIDTESVAYLKENYPNLTPRLIEGDFLRIDLKTIYTEPFAIIGNFPYNISSQILFKMIENRELVPELVGMFQKEVAMRIKAVPFTKEYGILSVLVQAFYECKYLFTVNETVFIPPPKVKSAVIRLTRKKNRDLGCNETLLFTVVKTAFNQRRKTLKNALSVMNINTSLLQHSFFTKRAEELSVADFVLLTNMIEESSADKK